MSEIFVLTLSETDLGVCFWKKNQSICFLEESQKFCEERVLILCAIITWSPWLTLTQVVFCPVCKLFLMINPENNKADNPLQSEWNRVNQHKTKIVDILSKKNLLRLPHLGHRSFSAPTSVSKLVLFVSGARWFSG